MHNVAVRVVFDPAKNTANRRKHGIDLGDASPVLDDPYVVTVEDEDADGERRFVSLGRDALGRLVVVVWTEREDTIRLLSARKASRGEGKHYKG